MTGYTAADIEQPPRWVLVSDEIVLAKGNYIVFVIARRADGTATIHEQGELFDVAGSVEDAVQHCERFARRRWPNDPAPTRPDQEHKIGAKAPDGKKYTSTNPFAAPI